VIVGVPTEVKDHESRVGLVPGGVGALIDAGHQVLVQSGAGVRSSLLDAEYEEFGAEIVSSAAAVWKRSELIIKVKEPQPSEYEFLRPGLTLFTYLHLAPLPELTAKLLEPISGSWDGRIRGEVFGRNGHVVGKLIGWGSPKR